MKNIILIGPMGAGKSTIGFLLAKKLHLNFLDTDKEVEYNAGASISWIFEKEGEAGFRERERKVLKDLSNIHNYVVATGGGIVINEENRFLLRQIGFVVYLKVSPKAQLLRLSFDKTRPLLQYDNPYKKLVTLFKKRENFYLEVADISVNTDSRFPNQIANYLIDKINFSRDKSE